MAKMKTYRIGLSNVVYVEVEATSESAAEKKVLKEIDKHYDYPWEEAADYDGWDVVDIEEVD